jgi:hypothetical protein
MLVGVSGLFLFSLQMLIFRRVDALQRRAASVARILNPRRRQDSRPQLPPEIHLLNIWRERGDIRVPEPSGSSPIQCDRHATEPLGDLQQEVPSCRRD